MKKYFYLKFLVIIAYSMVIGSCNKDFLNEKPDKSLLIPSTLSDFQALLDNATVMNQTPFLLQIASDDIYTTNAGFNAAISLIRNTYSWQKENLYDATVNVPDWNNPYLAIYYANTVLDNLKSFKISNDNDRSEVQRLEGQALFYRTYAYFNLIQTFTLPYNTLNSSTTLGLPLKLTSDVQERLKRSSLEQTYQQLVNDMKKAISLLPTNVIFKTRPNRQAGLALLSKIYLNMQDYASAFNYADECLKISSALLDYNSISPTAVRPFPPSFKDLNVEVLFYNSMLGVSFLTSSANTLVNTDLYSSYHQNDLRKTVYFTSNANGIIFRGHYTGATTAFTGLATDEVFLIRAECSARLGDRTAAMADLNTLMVKRWNNKVPFPEFTASDGKDALIQILKERRKELVFRNARWADLKRLNSEADFATTLIRTNNNITFTLLPNDLRYAFPIPESEISTSGIEQNQR